MLFSAQSYLSQARRIQQEVGNPLTRTDSRRQTISGPNDLRRRQTNATETLLNTNITHHTTRKNPDHYIEDSQSMSR